MIATSDRTNVTQDSYEYGGKRYKKEARIGGDGVPYTVDVEDPTFKAPATTPTTATGEKTVAQIYDLGGDDPLLSAAIARRNQSALDTSNETIDEDQIRADKLAEMQAEIDAQNAVYADKLRAAKTKGLGRLGTSTAIGGRRGTLGSDFGNAAIDTVENANTEIEDSIQNELAVKIAALQSSARTNADTEIAARRAAKEAGLDDYIKYLGENTTRKEANKTTLLNALIAQGIDPNTMDKPSLAAIAKGYGLASADVLNAYKLQKYTSDKAKKDADEKRKQDIQDELAKKGIQNITEGAMGYRLNPETNQYELVANNPKDFAPKAGTGMGGTGSGVISPEAQAWADLIIDGKATIANVPAAFRTQAAAALNKTKAQEGGLAQGMYDSIVTLENHPGFKSAVGTNALLGFGKSIGGTQSAGFLKALDTLKANLKLVNIKYLKGTGAISDAEGRTLENASTSLDPSLPESDFKTELERVKSILLKTRGDEINQTPAYGQSKIVTAPDGTQVEIVP